jgi:hypothetical protein
MALAIIIGGMLVCVEHEEVSPRPSIVNATIIMGDVVLHLHDAEISTVPGKVEKYALLFGLQDSGATVGAWFVPALGNERSPSFA